MNRWYARRRLLVIAMLAVLVADAGLYFGWVRRPVTEASADPAQVARLADEVAGLRAEVARLARVRERAPQFGPELEKFSGQRFLSARTGWSRVWAELEASAREAGVRLGRVSYKMGEERAEPELLRVEISSSVEGQYAGLLRYLDELERSPHLYLINELTLESARGTDVRLQLRLATYFRRSPA